MSTESRFYEQALREIEDNHRVAVLWDRALADADRDPKRAKARYIQLRVPELIFREITGNEPARPWINAEGACTVSAAATVDASSEAVKKTGVVTAKKWSPKARWSLTTKGLARAFMGLVVLVSVIWLTIDLLGLIFGWGPLGHRTPWWRYPY
jgi:hypothetical protein